MIDVELRQNDGTLITSSDGTPIPLFSFQPAPPGPPAYSVEDYRTALLALLPEGAVWPKQDGSTLSRVMDGVARGFARLGNRAAALLRDAPAGQLSEQLDAWEATLGLPDPCAGTSPTLEARRRQVLARIGARGGQSIPYLIAFAASLGFTVTVQEFTPFRFGRRFGQRFGGVEWAHTWRVSVANMSVKPARFGRFRFGERFATWGNEVLQCELARVQPGHTLMQFAVADGVFTLDKDLLT